MRVANLGSGNPEINRDQIGKIWPDATIISVDADPTVGADYRTDLRDMSVFPDGSFDGAFCSHILEHFSERDATKVLSEIWRILAVSGRVVIAVPNLVEACRLIVAGRSTDPLYTSPLGPIRPIDVIYGYQPQVEDHPLMAHHFGFDDKLLMQMMTAAGFATQVTPVNIHLVGEGVKIDRSDKGSDSSRENIVRIDSRRSSRSVLPPDLGEVRHGDRSLVAGRGITLPGQAQDSRTIGSNVGRVRWLS